jgi:probable phosphoglycerate mutase
MRLILVRHGQTSSNVGFLLDTAAPGADLDDLGREQAEALVEKLAGYAVEAIYTSDLVRTQQTATPIASARELELRVLPGLREISAGEDELSKDATRYVGTLLKWHAGELMARVPGGEDAAEFFDRFDAAIAEVAEAGHGVAMVVSHGAALRTWASARVPGFTEALGEGNLANTGVIVVDGSPADGWELHQLDGVKVFQWAEVNDEVDPAALELEGEVREAGSLAAEVVETMPRAAS